MPVRSKLPRIFSLKSTREISDLLKSGRRISGESLTVVWNPGDQFRYGVLVSRRFGPAVRRNRIKRLIREAIRLNRALLPATIQVAVLPKSGDGEPDFKTIDAEIRGIFDHIRPTA